MGEEVKISDYDAGGVDEGRVSEWEVGLPCGDDLTPLSQPLIPQELASAFSITPEPFRTNLDVNRASQNTLSSLRGQYYSNKFDNFKSFNEEKEMELDGDETDLTLEGSASRKARRVDAEEADSNNTAGATAATKRPRLVWTPQLHKRFVDVVAHLGIKNAVPKTIMQLMNVEGLTRENVASHLQKYRLYLKRMQGLSSNEGPSSSDHLFASTPVPQSLHESSGWNGTGNGISSGNGNGHVSVPIPMPNGPQVVPMPVYGHMGMPQPGAYPGFEYNMMQQGDWSGNKFGSFNSYHRITPSDK